MESDDDYESFSPEKTSPSPSPKHRRLKRLKKAAETVSDQSVTVEKPVSDVVESETLETLEMSDIRAVEESGEAALSEGFDNDDNDNDNDGDDDSGKDKELRSCYDDTRVDSELNDSKRDDLSLGDGGVAVRVERKETKRALDFDEEFNESDLVKSLRNEGEFENSIDVKSSEDVEKDGNFDAINGEIKKKKRSKRSREEIKANRSKEEIKVKPKKPTNKKAEEKVEFFSVFFLVF